MAIQGPDYGQCRGVLKFYGYQAKDGRPRKRGERCTRPALANGFCSVHGGKSPPRYCRRCTMQRSLRRHHIRRRDEGGPDTPENMIDLCEDCHTEWHLRFEDTVPFEAWVESPPGSFFVRLLLTGSTATLDAIALEWRALKAARISLIVSGLYAASRSGQEPT